MPVISACLQSPVPVKWETRFTYGGWGFGHKVNGFDDEPDSAPPQAAGWEGKEIPSDTVFEIAVHSELPEGTDEELVISSNGSPGEKN